MNRPDDAVRCCRSGRDQVRIRDDGATRLPLNLRVRHQRDVDQGDLIVVTGNAHPGDIMGRSEGEYAGFLRVPRPLPGYQDGWKMDIFALGDWSAAQTMDHIRDVA